jgi:hypothetical protein
VCPAHTVSVNWHGRGAHQMIGLTHVRPGFATREQGEDGQGGRNEGQGSHLGTFPANSFWKLTGLVPFVRGDGYSII